MMLKFNVNGPPEVKIVRNSIINDIRSPPPSLEFYSADQKKGKIKLNKNKFIRKENFGATILDRTGIYIVNKSGFDMLTKINYLSAQNIFKNGEIRKNKLKYFISKLLQYNILVFENDH